MGAVATLSLAEIPTAEASRTSHEETFFTDIKMLFTIAVIVVFAGYGIVEFVKNTANVLIVKLKDVLKSDEVTENVNARPSHVADDYFTQENEVKTSENKAVKVKMIEKGTGAGSSTDSTNAQTMMEKKPTEVTWPQPERDEYSRQIGIREDPAKGNQVPRLSPESQTFGTPEYFEMTTYWHKQYTNQKVRDKVTQTPVTYTFKNAQPRFTPMGEKAHGAWYAVNNFELKS